MRKIKQLPLVLIFTAAGFLAKAQPTIDRWVLGCLGGSASTGNYTVMYNAGEAVVSSLSAGTSMLTQGFEQADIPVIDAKSGHFYKGFTPNGDGKNDYWHIDSIGAYSNTVEIYNRWGNKVWGGENYDNVTVFWDGNGADGKPLPDGTYFYFVRVRDDGKGTGRFSPIKGHKGWVELTR